MSTGRIILVPPASPGSKGDEGMVRGALELFRDHAVVIVNPSPECLWLDRLALSAEGASVSEAPGPIRDFGGQLRPDDVLFLLGADIIDGTCGLEPSFERLDLMAEALLHGLPVFASCSFRSRVASEILERLRLMPGVDFLLRDDHSLENFRRQTGLKGRYFPDISFFCSPLPSATTESVLAKIAASEGRHPIIGLNFAEHSFRSFFSEHTQENRLLFIASILEELSQAHPEALYVLFSNDERRWDNHPSDNDYQDLALDWITRNLGEGCAVKVDPEIGYSGNIIVLGAVDLLVTGRMHLSLAAFRARTVPLVMMAEGTGYSSIDKMRGAFEKHLGTTAAVVSDVGRLGEVSKTFLSERPQLQARLAEFALEQTSSNLRDVERLMTDIEGSRVLAEDDGAPLRAALVSALASVIRRSDELAKERTLSDSLRDRIDGLAAAAHDERLKATELAARLQVSEHALAELSGQLQERERIALNLQAGIEAREQALKARELKLTGQGEARHRQEIDDLRRQLAEAKFAGEATHRQAEQRSAAMTAAGDRLVRELRRAYSKPLRPLRKSLERAALRFLLLATPVLPERTASSLRRSLQSRKPARFQQDWLVACGHAVEPARQRTKAGSSLHALALRTLASLVAPVSASRAVRLRRSADKRDPRKIAEARRDAELLISLTAEAAEHGKAKAPVVDPLRAKRILVADYRLPRPDVSAGERATFGVIADLRAVGFEVVFCATDLTDTAPYRQNLEALGVTVITHASGYNSASDYVRAEGGKFGAFYLVRFDVAEALLPAARQVAPDALVVLHAPDLYFLREGRAAELSGDPAMRAKAEATRAREVAMMRAVDHVILVSPAEIPFLAEYVDRDRISVFPALYSPVDENPPGYAGRAHLFFLGGFKHPPNVDAVLWFVGKVWPRIRAAMPDVEFHIVGAEAPPEVVALASEPGVRHIGYVADLEPVLASYRLSVAPLLYGAGIKGKLGASLGAGVPSVCTTIAAEGMGIVDGLHALIRDEPEAFADAVVALYRDSALWSRLADNGRGLVRENFGELANRSSLLRVLDRARVLPLDLYVESCRAAEPVAFPSYDASTPIDVSIIVPAYNKWELTRPCLSSVLIAGRATGIRYEVILADDGSTDETVDAATLFPGLRVAKGERNQGFLLNCKTAAARASGRHLLFLNNDTVVLPGWLEPLLSEMDADPRIAIAGSKLIYPDGAIQETGAVLYSDGSAGNIGRGRERQTPLYSLSREVDYATGASMLVRGSFWRELGGFDERYVPAYCEDSDLAMTARAKGHRVVCVAPSQVIHFEHGSYAAESTAQPKQLAQRHGAMLVEKWHDTFLIDHLPAGTPPDVASAHAERQPPLAALERRRSGALNVLYFSPFPSHPDNHGNQATIQAFARKFQQMGHKVHFALLESHMYDARTLAMMHAAWDSLDILPNSCGLGSDGQPIPFDGWYEEGLGEHIRLLCSTHDIDVVFCSYVFQSRLLDYVPAHILKVIDTHDKMGDRYEMLRRNGQPLEFFSCSPEEEGAYLRRADLVVARRAEEAAYFNSMTGRETAIVIPHVEEARFLDRSFTRMAHVGMVASANRINLAIALQLLQAIERQLDGKPCPFTLHIAGQVRDMIQDLTPEEAALFARPWVKLHGFVPDIGTFYAAADVVVSPVTMGTGINVKTVQAMAYGMPLLTTKWGGKGIETGDPMHGHADLDELVASLLRLAKDPSPLAGLADTSRRRYQAFYDDSIAAMEGMFAAVKH
ncbi:glycosyltransferase [Ancylobacter defluvii]|uniref:Glycosyl transferase family 1 n=1 Tax=Ancylobacter defluvii TaxID=1282440 RepID=A0A9W6JZ30_9HYPH|nr:glycosyltransferase [Ancylobacter defluvii]MBS7589113.1 glycosyltransferase [Ancylobacter defluvii]GLK84725.1 glycosyl transferase family 1 [Ancylobacter defluvii]